MSRSRHSPPPTIRPLTTPSALRRLAQPGWEELGPIARGALLRRLASALERNTDEFAREIATEVGKPVIEAKAEVARSIVTLYYVAEQGRLPVGEHYASDNPGALILTARRALGAVGIITPWNFPLNLPIWKLAPALLWGNSVVWKPAEQASLVARHLALLFADVGLPSGVLTRSSVKRVPARRLRRTPGSPRSRSPARLRLGGSWLRSLPVLGLDFRPNSAARIRCSCWPTPICLRQLS